MDRTVAVTTVTSAKRMHVWSHNGLYGCVRMMQSFLDRIYLSSSTTQEAKDIAWEMNVLNERLKEALKTRIDP